SRGLAVLAACATVCLLNPSFHRIYPAALEPFLGLFSPSKTPLTREQLSFFGKTSQEFFDQSHGVPGAHRMYVAYYLILVGIGLGSFALNRRRFALGRFLTFAAAAVLWACLIRLAPEFALVFAATLILNGQEWYQDRFGVEGHLGRGWAIWSV